MSHTLSSKVTGDLGTNPLLLQGLTYLSSTGLFSLVADWSAWNHGGKHYQERKQGLWNRLTSLVIASKNKLRVQKNQLFQGLVTIPERSYS